MYGCTSFRFIYISTLICITPSSDKNNSNVWAHSKCRIDLHNSGLVQRCQSAPAPVASKVGSKHGGLACRAKEKILCLDCMLHSPKICTILQEVCRASVHCALCTCKTQMHLCPPARGLLLQVSVANPLDRSSLSCSLAGGLHLAGEHCVLTSAVSLQQHQHEERNRLRSGVIHRLLLVPHKSGKIPRQSHAYRHHHLCKAHGIREKP